jgi:hypothetical protein
MMPIQQFRRVVTIALIVVAAVTFSATRAQAAILTVTDLNTTVQVDSSDQRGMFNWTVDGVNQMFQQWFWYRVGNTAEAAINTLTPTAAAVAGRNIVTNYSGAGFTVEVTYLVTGGTANSGTSDVAETIRIINTSNAPLDFHFFQYSDFDLCGNAGGETATFVNANTVDQTDIAGCHLSETVVTPDATHREAGIFANTLGKLNDGVATTLVDNNTSGFGDATWAFQWDVLLGINGTLIISKDKHLSAIPEPASLFLLGSGLLGGLKAVRRRRKA